MLLYLAVNVSADSVAVRHLQRCQRPVRQHVWRWRGGEQWSRLLLQPHHRDDAIAGLRHLESAALRVLLFCRDDLAGREHRCATDADAHQHQLHADDVAAAAGERQPVLHVRLWHFCHPMEMIVTVAHRDRGGERSGGPCDTPASQQA